MVSVYQGDGLSSIPLFLNLREKMKKAVFVTWVLSFFSANVWGMPPDRGGNNGTPLLVSSESMLVANPSMKSEKRVVGSPVRSKGSSPRKRELSQSREGEHGSQKRREKGEEVIDWQENDASDEQAIDSQKQTSDEGTPDGQITDFQKLIGLRKRIEKKEKENEDLSREIKEQKGQITSLVQQNAGLSQDVEERKLVVKAVNEYLDSSLEDCERRLLINQISAELWRSCGTNIVEKAKVLIPAIVAKILELQEKNNESDARIKVLQQENELNKERISKLEQEKGVVKNLQEEVQKLSDLVRQSEKASQRQGNRSEQSEMDVDDEKSNIIPFGGAEDFRIQASTLNSYDAVASSSGSAVVQNVAQGIELDNQRPVMNFGSVDGVGGGHEETIDNKRLGIKIKGRFVGKCLDLSKPVKFKGCYVAEQEFILSGLNSEKVKISREDLSNIDEARGNQGYLCLFSSKEKRGIIFGKKFVYKGEVDCAGKPNGQGIILKSTGEVVENRFSTNDWRDITK